MHEKVLMLEKATEEFRTNTRDDLQRMFTKLDTIHSALEVINSKPTCPDPLACVRIDKALADQNRRLVVLELARQQSIGERTVWNIVCGFVGAAVLAIIAGLWEVFHK